MAFQDRTERRLRFRLAARLDGVKGSHKPIAEPNELLFVDFLASHDSGLQLFALHRRRRRMANKRGVISREFFDAESRADRSRKEHLRKGRREKIRRFRIFVGSPLFRPFLPLSRSSHEAICS
jgi:hypothetical protein